MKRRSKAGGEASNARRRKTVRQKRPNAPNDVARHVSSATGAEREVVRLTRELNDALEQQTATSDVLQIISSSSGDLQPVFEAMLANAVRICDAKFGNIYRWDGEALYVVATTHNTPLAYAEARRRSPVRPNPNHILGRIVATKTVVHVLDAAEQREQYPEYVTAVELGGVRTCLAVPMLKEHELIGSISLLRQEVRPFTVAENFGVVSRKTDQTNCAGHWSDRRQPLKCFRSSAAPPAILSQCFRPCWRMRCASVMPSLATSIVRRATVCVSSPRTTHRLSSPRHAGVHRFLVPVRKIQYVA